MIKLPNGWCIDADSRCYSIGKLKTRVNKDGEVEEYLADVKYYSTIPSALGGIKEAERRNIVQSCDAELKEAIDMICASDIRLAELFGKMEDT